jgi:type IV pilus assembly protein PilV
MKTPHTSAMHARGFSLVEVMVAVVVICIGLLGIAKMQAMALSNTNMSRQRSLAAIEAASIASAMHSNQLYWTTFDGNAGNFSVTLSMNAAGQTVVASTDAALQAQTSADTGNLTACMGAATGLPICNAASRVDLAAFDLARWWVNSVSIQLPNPTATISCPAAPVGNPAPVSCTVQISWTEKAVAVNANEAQTESAGASTNEKPVFTLYVEP